MAENFSIKLIDNIVIITFNKQPDHQSIKFAVDTIKEKYGKHKRLWDVSSCGVNLTQENIMELAEYAKSNLPETTRAAVVASDDLSFGVSREYEVYRETESLETRVFRVYEEALKWLQSESNE